MVNPERLDASDISILILHHRPIGKGVGIVTTRRLWHCVRRDDVSSLRNVGRSNECRVARDSIVRMKLINLPGKQTSGLRHHVIWRACGRSGTAIIARQQAEMIGICVDDYASQRSAIYQVIDIECVRSCLLIGGVRAGGIQALEHIGGHVKPVRPDTHLGIIWKPRMCSVVSPDRIEPPTAADWIAGLRNSNALIIGTVLNVAPRKIRGDKPVILRNVDNGDVASVKCIARGSCAGVSP
jgi:hypothetical protein